MRESADRYDTLSQLANHDASGEISRAIVMLKSEQPEQAASILRNRVLAENPDHGVANAVLGFALQQAGQPGSLECFSRVLAVSLGPDLRAAALEGLMYA